MGSPNLSQRSGLREASEGVHLMVKYTNIPISQEDIDRDLEVSNPNACAGARVYSGFPVLAVIPCFQLNDNSIGSGSGPCSGEWSGVQLWRGVKFEYLRQQVLAVIRAAGSVARVGFLTLTIVDELHYGAEYDWKQAQARWNSFMSNALKKRYRDWCAVIEPTKQGRVHWHLIVNCHRDIQTGTDMDRVRREDYRGGSYALRREWAWLRDRCRRYGFGRHFLEPVKDEQDAMARYIGKYLLKGELTPPPGFRRNRRSQGLGISRGIAATSSEWRKALAFYCERAGAKSESQLRQWYGSKWAYKLRWSILGGYRFFKLKHGNNSSMLCPELGCESESSEELCYAQSRGQDNRVGSAHEEYGDETEGTGPGGPSEPKPVYLPSDRKIATREVVS